jgi:polyribonucleotide nucleotidyltransferase
MSVDTILQASMREIPKAVAVGVVDMTTGMLLGVKTIDSHPQEVLDLVAAGTKDLFEGENVTMIERLFKRVRGVDTVDHYFREIIVTSTNLVHVFCRLKANQEVVLCVVTRLDVNLGLALTKTRSIASTDNI